jgi:hypothetical protein
MNRRRCLAFVGIHAISITAGCGNRVGSDVKEKLEFRYGSVETAEQGWNLLVRTHIPKTGRVPEVRIVVYGPSGELVGAKQVGDLTVGGDHELQCSGVPVVVTATTAFPCEEVDVELLYWTGPTEYDRIGADGVRWQTTTVRCEEPLHKASPRRGSARPVVRQ